MSKTHVNCECGALYPKELDKCPECKSTPASLFKRLLRNIGFIHKPMWVTTKYKVTIWILASDNMLEEHKYFSFTVDMNELFCWEARYRIEDEVDHITQHGLHTADGITYPSHTIYTTLIDKIEE